MPTVLRSGPGPILLAIQSQLVASLGWPAERVLIADPSQFPLPGPQADQFLLMWPAEDSPELPTFEGGGRVDFRVGMRLGVTMRTRFSVDEVSSSLAWLTDAGLGHVVALVKVWNALAGFKPTDTGDSLGNWLCTEPLKPAGVTRPAKNPKDRDWGESTVGFMVYFAVDVDQSYQ